MLRRLLLPIVCAAAVFATPVTAQTPKPAFIRGIVVDTAGKPIPDVNVTVRLAERNGRQAGQVVGTATSDSKGRFTIGDVPSKTRFVFTARKLGYAVAASEPATLTAGDTTDLRFELAQATLAPVQVVSSIPTTYRIDSTEIKKHSVRDALDVLLNYRPRMLGDVYKNCAPDTSRLTIDPTRYIRPHARFYGDLNSYPLQLYINGVRWMNRGIKDILADIPASDIQEMHYIDCWDNTTPQFRNSLIVVLKPGIGY